jgi:ADP-heptose:LPS heptosyltransferase
VTNAGAEPRERILVIKLASLGDVVQAFGPFAAIRAHHPRAHITLLTTPPYAGLAGASPWFDEVWREGRPGWTNVSGLVRLALRLRRGGFHRVYDLQTSRRSSRYRRLVGLHTEWSGIARGASHPHRNPLRDRMHTVDRQREQLKDAGIVCFPEPDLGWLDAAVASFGLPPRYVLLIPGASRQRPGKRWPAERFAELAARLPMPAVIAGGPDEADTAAVIRSRAPAAMDLTGRTTLLELGAIARRAALAIGNDTGPTHLAAAAGRPTLVLFGKESDPALCAPRGTHVQVLQEPRLAALETDTVEQAAARMCHVDRHPLQRDR